MRLHATAAALHTACGWRGVLLRGGSGSGKSDLALRLMGRGWRLVADDYAEIWACDGALYATAPERLRGLIEARGLGLMRTPVLEVARMVLIADCDREPERLPEPESAVETLCGTPLARIDLRALDASAPARLELALRARRAVTLGNGDALA